MLEAINNKQDIELDCVFDLRDEKFNIEFWPPVQHLHEVTDVIKGHLEGLGNFVRDGPRNNLKESYYYYLLRDEEKGADLEIRYAPTGHEVEVILRKGDESYIRDCHGYLKREIMKRKNS